MEEALELEKYLPLSFKTRSEQDYIRFLWEAFESNYENNKCQFAFLAYHMLTMSFIYFNIWQIKQTEPLDFAKAMVGFNKDLEKELVGATSPFTFWRVNESSVMRFLKLIGCDNGKVGKYAALVKERNDTAHSNGNIFFSTQAALDAKIRDILRAVDEIQTHSIPVIQRCYARFLHESNNPDDREYSDDIDQIREILIHGHYLSRKDIGICAAFDILDEFNIHANFPRIESLHQSVKIYYENE
jgi:hypothetical protein